MASPLRWWVIPGALVVMVRIVTLADSGSRAPTDAAAEASAPSGSVVAIRDAVGRPGALHLLDATGAGLTVELPDECRGRRVQLTMWRHVEGVPEPVLWLQGTPKVAKDAALPIDGLTEGRYDVEVVFDAGAGAPVRSARAQDVAVPGRVRLAL